MARMIHPLMCWFHAVLITGHSAQSSGFIKEDCVNWPVTVTWKVFLCSPYMAWVAEHSYVPSCKLFTTLPLDSLVLNPSVVSSKPMASRSTIVPLNFHETDWTGGLAKMSHHSTNSASISTVTFSDPESCGASDGEITEITLLYTQMPIIDFNQMATALLLWKLQWWLHVNDCSLHRASHLPPGGRLQ